MPGTGLSVPFSIDASVSDILNGILEIDGLLTYEGDELILEYRTGLMPGKSSFGTPLQTCRIRLEDVQDIEYREKVFSTRITLTPRRLAVIDDLPGDHSTEITLKIKKKYRRRAAALASDIQLDFARNRHDSVRSIPFLMPTASKDFAEIGGLLYTEDEFLVFEIQSGISGGSRKKDQIVKIEKKAIRFIDLSKAVLKDILSVQPKRQQLLDVLPGDHVDAVRLKINNTYRSEVERLIADVRAAGDLEGDD